VSQRLSMHLDFRRLNSVRRAGKGSVEHPLQQEASFPVLEGRTGQSQWRSKLRRLCHRDARPKWLLPLLQLLNLSRERGYLLPDMGKLLAYPFLEYASVLGKAQHCPAEYHLRTPA